jgi:hypothetical protein
MDLDIRAYAFVRPLVCSLEPGMHGGAFFKGFANFRSHPIEAKQGCEAPTGFHV